MESEKDKMMGFCDLAEDMYTLAKEYGQRVTAVLFYEEARKLFHELVMYDDVNIVGFSLSAPQDNHYIHEYYIDIEPNGDISVEPAKFDIYLDPEPDVMFIDGDASSAILKFVTNDCYIQLQICGDTVEYVIDTECEEKADCDIHEEHTEDCDCDHCNEIKISFLLNEKDLFDLYHEPKVYESLLEIINRAICTADYTINENGEIISVDVNASPIFESFRY